MPGKIRITLQYIARHQDRASATPSWLATGGAAGAGIQPTQISTQITMKSTIFLFVLYVFAGSGAQAETMGQTAIQATADSGNGNLLCAQQATLSLAGTLTSMSFYVSKVGGPLSWPCTMPPDQAEDRGILKLRPRHSRR